MFCRNVNVISTSGLPIRKNGGLPVSRYLSCVSTKSPELGGVLGYDNVHVAGSMPSNRSGRTEIKQAGQIAV